MKRITKFEDQDVLNATLELVTGLSGLNDQTPDNPQHVGVRIDAARAAVDFGYRKTDHCDRQCEDYLNIAV